MYNIDSLFCSALLDGRMSKLEETIFKLSEQLYSISEKLDVKHREEPRSSPQVCAIAAVFKIKCNLYGYYDTKLLFVR